MRNSFLLISLLVVAACQTGPKKEKDMKPAAIATIDSLEAVLLNDSLGLNEAAAANLTKAYLQFADRYSKDTLSVDYLFRAADVMRGMFRMMDAVQTLDLITKRYPNHDKAAVALFYAGFILHADADQNTMAADYFDRLIEEYPDHPMADEARNMLPMLKLSDEQILEFLDRKQPEKEEAEVES